MQKDRFLDVNGLNSEYNIKLEKRLNKYRKVKYRDPSRPSISDAEILRIQSASWRSRTRRNQVISAVVAILLVAGAVALAWYLTYGF